MFDVTCYVLYIMCYMLYVICYIYIYIYTHTHIHGTKRIGHSRSGCRPSAPRWTGASCCGTWRPADRYARPKRRNNNKTNKTNSNNIRINYIVFMVGPISSHSFNSQDFKLRVSNPRTVAYFRFNTPFDSSNLPRAGPIFPDQMVQERSLSRPAARRSAEIAP